MKHYICPAIMSAVFLVTTGCAKRASDYIVTGDTYFERADYQNATLYYRKAIDTEPRNAEAAFRLGRAYLRQGRTAEAYAHLRAAVENNPAHIGATTELADLTLALYLASNGTEQNLYDAAQRLITQIRKHDPNSPEGLRLQGHLLQSERKLDEAEVTFRRALSMRPGSPDILVAIADVLFEKGQSREAIKTAHEAIRNRPSFEAAYNVLIKHYRSSGQTAELEGILALRVSENPDDARAATDLALFYYQTGQNAKMQNHLDHVANRTTLPKRFAVLGDVYMQARMPEDAVKAYQRGLNTPDGEVTFFRKKIVNAYIALNRRRDAFNLLEEIARANPDDAEPVIVKATLQASDPVTRSEAVASLRKFLKDHDDPRTALELGRILLTSGDTVAARSLFSQAAAKDKSYAEPRIELAILAKEVGDFKGALRYANEALAIRDNIAARTLRAVANVRLGNDAASRELTELANQHPNIPQIQIELATTQITQRRYKEAEASARRVFVPGNVDRRALALLIDALIGQRRGAEALTLLNSELVKAPQAKDLRALYARAAFASGKREVAEQEFLKLAAETPDNATYHQQLGEIYLSTGALSLSADSYRRAADLTPGDASLQTMLAFVEDRLGNKDRAVQRYKESALAAPNDVIVLNNLAYALAETGSELDKALHYAVKAVNDAPGNPYIADTLGWVHMKRNSMDDALRIFGQLSREHPNVPVFRIHYAMALESAGDRVGARSQLTEALKRKPSKQETEQIRELQRKLG